LLRAGGVAALFAVVGPGVLAGFSDDDPAGITTYSILGAKFGYRLLWVLAVSTLALIVFHELGARMGVVTKKGLLALVRDHFGPRGATLALSALVVANLGTLCAEFAGVAAGLDLLAGVSRYLSVPLAAIGVSLLVLRGSFHRVEHVLLALASVFVAYIVSGFLARPDWGATARGLVVPGMPLTRDAVLVAVATLGTTLAPWGLAFIQSYAVDKKLTVEDLRYERVDVIVGAVLTGVIGLFIVVACAATLHVNGITINDASDAAGALEPLAGQLAATLFGLGFLGAALLAACIVPLSTAYSVAEAFRQPGGHQRPLHRSAPLLPLLRGDGAAGRRDRADPRRAAGLDPVSLPGAQRRPAALDPALHAPPCAGPGGDGRPRARAHRQAHDRDHARPHRRLGCRARRPERHLEGGSRTRHLLAEPNEDAASDPGHSWLLGGGLLV
jgi:NRAMP (natural resistance-associated macrophage protein)-like metal ion transporter